MAVISSFSPESECRFLPIPIFTCFYFCNLTCVLFSHLSSNVHLGGCRGGKNGAQTRRLQTRGPMGTESKHAAYKSRRGWRGCQNPYPTARPPQGSTPKTVRHGQKPRGGSPKTRNLHGGGPPPVKGGVLGPAEFLPP